MIEIEKIMEQIFNVNDQDTCAGEYNELLMDDKTTPSKDYLNIKTLFSNYQVISVAEFIDICSKISNQNDKCKFMWNVLDLSNLDEFSPDDEELINSKIMPMIDTYRQGLNKGFNPDDYSADNYDYCEDEKK